MMTMSKIEIYVDWVPSNFSARPVSEEIACVATGKTLEEVQQNIMEALAFHVEGLQEQGEMVPAELRGEWHPVFHLSTRAQLKYADRYITRKALARETGIAEQQLSHYANGQRHPRPDMQRRITSGIRSICNRLAVIL